MLHALTMTTLAGLSTGLGGLIVFFFRRPGPRLMAFSLGFAGGVMLTVSLSDMLPHTVETYSASMERFPAALCSASLCVMGMLAGLLLEKCVPEEAELGARAKSREAVPACAAARRAAPPRPATPAKPAHSAVPAKPAEPAKSAQTAAPVKPLDPADAPTAPGALRAAMVTTAAIVLHNLPEGILTLFTGYASPALGLTLTLAIAMHNIPEGIAIAVPVYYATGSRARGFGYALASGLAEPAGALLAFLLLRDKLNPLFLNGLIALIAGIMIYVSISELVPDAFAHGKRGFAVAGIAAGILAMNVGIYLV